METETSSATESIGNDELIAAAAAVDDLGLNPDAAFVESVRTGSPTYPDFAIALEAHRLTDAAYRSAAAGGSLVHLT